MWRCGQKRSDVDVRVAEKQRSRNVVEEKREMLENVKVKKSEEPVNE